VLRRRVGIAAVTFAFIAACTQDATTPTERTLRPSASQAPPSRAALEAQINSLINALYAPTAQGNIFSAFARIKADLASGKTATAQADLVAFFSRVLADERNGVLQDPNGTQPPTTAEALRSLLSSVATLGGVTSPIPASSSDGAVAVIGTAGGTLVSSSGFGGVSFPAGALPADVIVVINRLPAPSQPKTGPLPTTLDQYPLFYEFSTIPAIPQFNQEVTVGVCQLEVGDPFAPATQAIADRLQLAHPNPTNPTTVELLPRVNANFMQCDGVSLASAATSAGSTRLASAINTLSRLRTRVADFFLPTPAYAVHGGLGGKVSSFSPFGAVDPGVMTVGVCSSPMAGVSATFATIEQAIANVNVGGDIRLCPQTITLANTIVVTKPVTIEGSDPANRPQIIVPSTLGGAVSTFTVGTGFVVQPTIQGSVTFRNLAFTLTTTPLALRVVAIDLGIGQGVGNEGSWWEALVERNTFTMPAGLGRAVVAFQTVHARPKFTFQFNQATGGGFSVVTLIGSPESDVEILSNSFTGPFGPSGVLIQNEGSARVTGNIFTSCGAGNECVRVTQTGATTVSNNSFSIPSSGSTGAAIVVHNGLLSRPATATITSNSILGGGLTGPASDTLSYRFRGAGILLGLSPFTGTSPETAVNALTATVSSNIITNAASGIRIEGGGISVTGTNNTISTAHSVVRLDNSSGTPSSLVTHGNDFSSFVSAIRFSWPAPSPSTIDVTCNWWGTAAGPLAFAAGIPTSMYVPFATGPVVNNAGGQCNGSNP